VRAVVEDVAFEVGSYWGMFLAGFWACGAWVDRRSRVLWDIIGLHGTLQGHFLPVDFVNRYANGPMVVSVVGWFGSADWETRNWRHLKC